MYQKVGDWYIQYAAYFYLRFAILLRLPIWLSSSDTDGFLCLSKLLYLLRIKGRNITRTG